MERDDVRQWRFRGPGTQLRPGSPVVLYNEVVDVEVGAPGESLGGIPPGSAVTLRRAGSSPDPVRGGERLAVYVEGVGFLAAASDGPGIATRPGEAAEWIVTGVAPGVAVPVDRPVALFDAVQGDHLVCLDGAGGPVLAWSAEVGRTGPPGPRDGVPLPMPPQFRPPEGVPGDVELCGALVPVRDGDLSAGVLVLLDPPDARLLGAHLAARVPDLAATLAPERSVGAVACRWGAGCDGAVGGLELPPAGARLWVQGSLVAEPGVCVRPVRVLAWALDADGDPVLAGPDEPQWPAVAISWQLLLLPVHCEDNLPEVPVAVYLPLPGRDGEPGSTTTFTPLRSGPGGARTVRGARGATAPAVVRDPRTGRRAVRIGIAPADAGAATTTGCTVRVHLPTAADQG